MAAGLGGSQKQKEDLKIYVTANRLTTDNKIKKIITEEENILTENIEGKCLDIDLQY